MKTPSHWPKHFYLIAAGNSIGGEEKPSSETLGGKAFNLLRMAEIGLPVPSALVLGTHYTQCPEAVAAPLFSTGIPALEQASGLILGDARRPLIVSVRSGAPVSMPGMMETLLNVGLCDQTLSGFTLQTGNPRLVWDAYRRLVAAYGEIVAGLSPTLFENEMAALCDGRDERQLDFAELRDLTRRFLAIYQQHAGKPFPQSPQQQLLGAVHAVFASWHAEKACAYRATNHIDAAIGTAVTIQCMVFGNTGSHSGSGVGFTRDPATGERKLWVDFLSNAQGEDVVSGHRNAYGHQILAEILPATWRELESCTSLLETAFADMQDFEFTVQDGALHLLQTRRGKRTPLAAARIALDLLQEGVIDEAEALAQTAHLQEQDIGTSRTVSLGREANAITALGTGISACTGVVAGEIALDAERAMLRAAQGVKVILVRQDAETHDYGAIEASAGLLTQRGARTSHAAVVARELGKVCLVACASLAIETATRTIRIGNQVLQEGDVITLDGNVGSIYPGMVATVFVPDEALIKRLRALRASPSAREVQTGYGALA